MLYTNPFQQPGQWYRGNTHSHSTESDGQLSIGDRFAAYRDAGYDFLVLTDHRKVNDVQAYTTPDFLAISGSEVHPDNPYGGDTYHFVAINIHERINCSEMHPNAVLDDIKAQGGEAVLCHPYWSGHTILDYLPLREYFAIEVYNDSCVGIGKEFSEQAWDDLLDRGGPVLGIAADDSHGTEDDCFHGWIMVKAEELTLESIMESLRTGAFYSTLGPEIKDLTLDGKELTVKCSEAQSIVFKAQCSRGKRVLPSEGERLTEATYSIPESVKYVRVEITDETGKKAWSNPFFF
ncbi:MAG: CehA/McbA family metallohydrolase [Candidatus Poribacteria bacterium]|nr:CehA/McbA family metallohydrolase [Candidatus Poribacteria bacterium]MYK17301.1 PHP domain-containing protein [Candidatus Poribacteria bacterium]